MERDNSFPYVPIFLLLYLIAFFIKRRKRRGEKKRENAPLRNGEGQSGYEKRGLEKGARFVRVSERAKAALPVDEMRSAFPLEEADISLNVARTHRSKIQKWVDLLPSKRGLILLSEVLNPYEPF